MPTSIDHIHTFVRTKKPKGYFKCDDPKCFCIKPRELVAGKESLCAVCHETIIILTPSALQRSRPRCMNCSNTIESRRLKKVKELLESAGVDFEEVRNS